MTSWEHMAADATPAGDASGAVTLVESTTFSLCTPNGDMIGGSDGLFFNDTRFVSRWELRVDGRPLDHVAADVDVPYSATFVGREHPPPGTADSTLIVTRRRSIGHGLCETIEVHNFDNAERRCRVELVVGTDFAGLFEVKRGEVASERTGSFTHQIADGRLLFDHVHDGVRRGVVVSFTGDPTLEPGRAGWGLMLAPHASASVCIEAACRVGEVLIQPRHRCGDPLDQSFPAQQYSNWRNRAGRIESDHRGFAAALKQGIEDLGALRMIDVDHPEREMVAAGAPWYMTLFGRDSLITGWMALLVDPALARGVLQTLAGLQGTQEQAVNEEQPGRILHEMRFGASPSTGLEHGEVYYGTADATPLFVMLLGELHRWGCDPHVIADLLPAADRALRWIEGYGDTDGDGYVEYGGVAHNRLANQGWKDSWDAVSFADGRLASAPLAVCEVQAYVYGAYLARADLAEAFGDAITADRCRARGANLKQRFNEDYWMDQAGTIALALDRDKRQVDAIASNVGHCLWTGIVDADKADSVAERLVAPDMFTGWGVRTLAASMGRYNPISYHNGSVWPHDNALAIAGLVRYGRMAEAHRLTFALLDLASRAGGRLPELVAGIDRSAVPSPVHYPNSCQPQAWAAATPVLVARSLLGLEPDVPHRRIDCRPAIPTELGRLRAENVAIADHRLTIDATPDGVEISGLPSNFSVNSPA